MRRVSLLIAVCFVLAVTVGMMGQARNLDTIMKEVGPLWQGGLGARGGVLDTGTDTAKIAADAAKLQSLFMEVEAEFTKLKMTEAAGIAKSVAEAAGAASKEAKTGKMADTKASKAAINQCKSCHDKTKVSDGAGGWTLKTQ